MINLHKASIQSPLILPVIIEAALHAKQVSVAILALEYLSAAIPHITPKTE